MPAAASSNSSILTSPASTPPWMAAPVAYFVWVNALHWVLPNSFFTLNHCWRTGHTTNHDDVVDVELAQLGIFERFFYWPIKAVSRSFTKSSSSARQAHLKVLAHQHHVDEWNIDIILSDSQRLFLCLLGFVLERCIAALSFAIDTFFGLEVIESSYGDGVVSPHHQRWVSPTSCTWKISPLISSTDVEGCHHQGQRQRCSSSLPLSEDHERAAAVGSLMMRDF